MFFEDHFLQFNSRRCRTQAELELAAKILNPIGGDVPVARGDSDDELGNILRQLYGKRFRSEGVIFLKGNASIRHAI